MNLYGWVKLLHIVSATLVFGTGLGIAFMMLKAYLLGNRDVMRATTGHVVLADWMFTSPAVIVQFLTGLWLTKHVGIAFNSLWFVLVASLFTVFGACWWTVVWIQIRIRKRQSEDQNPAAYRMLMRTWTVLCCCALSAVLALFYLMVSKWGAGQTLLF